MLEVAESGVLRYGSFFISWFLGCFALAAIATVVNGLDKGESEDVWIRDRLQRARAHFAPLLLAAAVTFGMFLAGMAAIEFVVFTLVRVVGWPRFSGFIYEASLVGVLVVSI